MGETGRTYVIGGDAEIPNLALVQMLLDTFDEVTGREPGTSRELITFVKDRAGHDFRYAMDFSRIRSELGWAPRHSLADGLRETVEWYLSHREWVEAVSDDSYRDYYQRQYELR
jgi:dTDP-glucose 4,6-dehydratase